MRVIDNEMELIELLEYALWFLLPLSVIALCHVHSCLVFQNALHAPSKVTQGAALLSSAENAHTWLQARPQL